MFNGEGSPYTEKAKEIYDHAVNLVNEKKTELHELQSRIEAPAAAIDNQSVDYNTMDDDELTRDTAFGNMEDTQQDVEDTQQDAAELFEANLLQTDDEMTMDAWEESGLVGLAGSQMQMSGQVSLF